jgi:prepilin-type N-terminal cleavage/methylation domain-containing protein
MIRPRTMQPRMTARPGRSAQADRSAPGPGGSATHDGRRKTAERGFTLVELLAVIVVLGILMALLLPAINAALRTGREAAVLAEINQLAQALESFKSKYGDYPPSRFLCVENGNYLQYITQNSPPLNAAGGGFVDPMSPGTLDITQAQLAQRSMTYLRKFWPRVNTSGNLPTGAWYDFNGNGTYDQTPYVLHGHECLVFFLGGVPLHDPGTGTYGLTGFGKDPTNPFTNNLPNNNNMYNANRQPSFYDFNPGRLFADPNSASGMPAYYDTMNSGPPTGSGMNFYAYFSAYGNGNYDPNDCNLATEPDALSNGPIWLQYYVTFPTYGNTTTPASTLSPSPNPYTSTLTEPVTGTITYQKPQTYQIISAGSDGLYGVGGQYTLPSQSQSATTVMVLDPKNTYVGTPPALATDPTIRQREYDNLTNWKTGRLQ